MLMNEKKPGIGILIFMVWCALGGLRPEVSRAQEALHPPVFGKFQGLNSPLHIPLVLSGNFGELRQDHFHTGLVSKQREERDCLSLPPAMGWWRESRSLLTDTAERSTYRIPKA
jgi:hypothetical protein